MGDFLQDQTQAGLPGHPWLTLANRWRLYGDVYGYIYANITERPYDA